MPSTEPSNPHSPHLVGNLLPKMSSSKAREQQAPLPAGPRVPAIGPGGASGHARAQQAPGHLPEFLPAPCICFANRARGEALAIA